MATVFFTQLDDNNVVVNCTRWDDSILGTPQSEQNGKDFLANEFGVSADKFVQTFTDRTRKQFASVGCTYDAENDVFITPKPFASWVLNSEFEWEAPFPDPAPEGFQCRWNEGQQTYECQKISDETEYMWNKTTNEMDPI
jgi:hypothetical protein|tara:strand:- start:2257 stop:2676 length:420 start_codon:yes stop_codon:yes gene_type:complete